MSFETTLKIWDLFAYHGEVIHFRLGLCILSLIAPKIIDASYEDTIGIIRDFCYHLDEKKLLNNLLSHKLSYDKLENALKKVKNSKTLEKHETPF